MTFLKVFVYKLHFPWYNKANIEKGDFAMNVAVKDIQDVVTKMYFDKCGTITCIYNIDGKCSQNKCELYERGLLKEED